MKFVAAGQVHNTVYLGRVSGRSTDATSLSDGIDQNGLRGADFRLQFGGADRLLQRHKLLPAPLLEFLRYGGR